MKRLAVVTLVAASLATSASAQDPFTGVTFDPALMVEPTMLREVAPGLFVRDLTPQTGQRLEPGQVATLRMRAWLSDGTTVPESSREVTYRLGDGTMLERWDVAISGMAEGSRRQIVIAPLAAYEHGVSSSALPAVVVFEVELLRVG